MLKVLDLRGIEAVVPLKETRIREMVAAGQFPAPCKLGGRKLCWLADEVEAWVQSQFAKREPAGKRR